MHFQIRMRSALRENYSFNTKRFIKLYHFSNKMKFVEEKLTTSILNFFSVEYRKNIVTILYLSSIIH